MQGGAATLTKLVMNNIANDKILNDLGFRMLVVVHDEVLGECPSDNAEKALDRLCQVMVDSGKGYMNVPLKCDGDICSHWYENEYSTMIISEYKKLREKEKSEEESLNEVVNNHIEVDREYIEKIIKSYIN